LVIALILLASVHLAAAQQGGLPAGLTRDLSRTAVAVPEGVPDGCPLGCDPVVNVTDGSLLIRVPAGEFIIFPDFAKTVNPWWFDSPIKQAVEHRPVIRLTSRSIRRLTVAAELKR
jgi:hypothetical protein